MANPTHTLDTRDHLSGVTFQPQADGTVVVTWWEIDQGTVESGPSSRHSSERMPAPQARQVWREARAEGLRPRR